MYDIKRSLFWWLLYTLYSLSTACTTGREISQGCSLSPLLYLVYDEAMIREATDNMKTGISVRVRMSNTIRHADDKALVANSHKRVTLLQQLLLIT